jgi:hypothetical protein
VKASLSKTEKPEDQDELEYEIDAAFPPENLPKIFKSL